MFSFFILKKISTFKDLKSKREGKQIIRRKSFNAAVRFRFSRASQVALVVKNLPANAGDIIDVGSIPGSGKIPWKRAGQLTQVLLPGKSHRHGSLAGYSPWGRKESDETVAT